MAIGPLSFLLPWAFSGLLLVPLLVWAYLRRRNRRQKIISSTFILAALPQRSSVRRRIKLPFRFFLELLALLLLIGAAAMPLWHDRAQRIAVVIDTSLSMGAAVADPSAQQSRLDQAKQRLTDWIENAEGHFVYTLFSSAPTLARVGDENLSPTSVQSVASGLSVSPSSDALETAIRQLAEDGQFDVLLVITDKIARPSSYDVIDAAASRTETTALHVGEPVDNVFFEEASLEPASTASSPIAHLSIGNASANSQSVSVLFRPLGEERQQQLTRLSLKPNVSTKVSLPLPAPVSNTRGFEFSLSANAAANAIVEDDRAWLLSGAARPGGVLVVTPISSPETRIALQKLQRLQVSYETPEEYAARSPESLQGYEAIIFHLSAPRSASFVSSLFVLPPANNAIFPTKRELTNAQVTSWQDDHPLTAYLKVPLLELSAATIFQPQLWAEPILSVSQGPIMLAGESRGVRFAAVGFELFPFVGAEVPVRTVLTLNILNWLTRSVQLGEGQRTGANIRLNAAKDWQVTRPDGSTLSLQSKEGAGLTFPTTMPGVYRARSAAEQQPLLFAVNSFLPQESWTSRDQFFSYTPTTIHSAITPRGDTPEWPLLLSAVLLLLLFDVWHHAVRERHNTEAVRDAA